MVNRAFVNVGRWSALAFGLVYGFSHNASLQKQEDVKKQQLEYERQEKLIEKARLAYAAKQNATAKPVAATESVDVDSPDFDFDKFIAQLEAQEKK